MRYIGKWVKYEIDGVVRRGKIESIVFHQKLGKPMFNLISPYGNRFSLSKDEIL